MTNPVSSSPSDKSNWLGRYITVQQAADVRVNAALREARDDAEAAALALDGKPGIGAAVRKAQLLGAQGSLTKVLSELYRIIGDIVRSGQEDARLAAIRARIIDERWIMQQLVPDREERRVMEKSYVQSANRGTQILMRNALNEDSRLSQRLYHSEATAKNLVSRTVNSHIARGSSAADIARDVKRLINPSAPGGVSAVAKRLARTELNNAFHAQSIADNEDRPWVVHVEWRLSGSHPQSSVLCKCEIYARQKNFPKDNVPGKPHPNCLCYLVPVVVDQETFLDNLLLGRYEDWLNSNTPAST